MRVDRLRGLASVQDGGRAGMRHLGLPPGGPLVPEALAAANLAVGNRWDAPAIELIGGISLGDAGGLAVSVADGVGARTLSADGSGVVVVHPAPGVRYVAVQGGLAVERVLGGRGASWSAGIGRPLTAGDLLPVGLLTEDPPRSTPERPRRTDGAMEVVPGPDHDAFVADALDALLGQRWVVDVRSDRTGLRLGPGVVPRRDPDDRDSAPMVRGAIQVPRDGRPVVLGPDHPVTGGYPVVACVISRCWGLLGAALPGATLRFVLAEPP